MRSVSDGLVDSWHEVIATVSRNKLRSLLTACGVFWGIFMLVLMLGIGKGLENGVQRNLGDLTMRSIFVWAQSTSMPYRGTSPGRHLKFQNADTDALRAIPGVEQVAPRLRLGGRRDGVPVSSGAKSGFFAVLGDCPELLQVEPIEVRNGRFINARDLEDQRKVAVVGDEVRKVLFANKNPVGGLILVRGIQFQIVGEVLSHRGGEEGDRIRSSVFVPFSTFQLAFNQPNRVGWFALTARLDAPADEVDRQVRSTLIARHRVHPDDAQAVGSFNAAERLGKVSGLFRGIQAFVWFVGTLTLLAGVLGVSNILLITVKERTRELGIRKALGATPWNMFSMILKESIALTSMSGYLGLVAGVAALALIARAVAKLENAPLYRPEIDLGVALVATLVLVVSGALAGIVPARQAVLVSPVEALRNE